MTSNVQTEFKWLGPAPVSCDLCDKELTTFFIDGITKQNQWCVMCPHCFMRVGVKVAYGKGQQYDVKSLKLMAGGPSPEDCLETFSA